MNFENTEIDEVKRYWNNRPCNIRHSNKPFGTKEYFDEVEKRKYFVEPHIPWFAEFHKWQGKNVLEIGCGIGTDSINFARCGANITCVDVSEESLNICKKRFDVYGLDAKFYNADVEKLSDSVPFDEWGGGYDLIYSFGVLHHTPHPEMAVSELKKYMSKNTELRIMMYNKASFKVLELMEKNQYAKVFDLDSIIADNSEAQYGCPVTYSYTINEIYDLLSGYNVCSISVDHIFSYDVEEYKKYNYQKNWMWKNMDNGTFRRFEQTYGWHLLIKAKLSGEISE